MRKGCDGETRRKKRNKTRMEIVATNIFASRPLTAPDCEEKDEKEISERMATLATAEVELCLSWEWFKVDQERNINVFISTPRKLLLLIYSCISV